MSVYLIMYVNINVFDVHMASAFQHPSHRHLDIKPPQSYHSCMITTVVTARSPIPL